MTAYIAFLLFRVVSPDELRQLRRLIRDNLRTEMGHWSLTPDRLRVRWNDEQFAATRTIEETGWP